MRLGFWPPVYGNWIISTQPETRNASFEYTKRATLLAERLGFQTLLLAEHFMNPVAPEMEQLDAWTTASALAAVTERIEILTAVKPGFRAPGVIAKMASNIDHISQGRFAVNLVSAWWLSEFEMLGAPVLAHDDRYARSEEFLEVIVGSWTECTPPLVSPSLSCSCSCFCGVHTSCSASWSHLFSHVCSQACWATCSSSRRRPSPRRYTVC